MKRKNLSTHTSLTCLCSKQTNFRWLVPHKLLVLMTSALRTWHYISPFRASPQLKTGGGRCVAPKLKCCMRCPSHIIRLLGIRTQLCFQLQLPAIAHRRGSRWQLEYLHPIRLRPELCLTQSCLWQITEKSSSGRVISMFQINTHLTFF